MTRVIVLLDDAEPVEFSSTWGRDTLQYAVDQDMKVSPKREPMLKMWSAGGGAVLVPKSRIRAIMIEEVKA